MKIRELSLECAAHADLVALAGELRAGLDTFWRVAAEVFTGGPIQLQLPGDTALALERNFFSFLFLYSYFRAGAPPERRVLYVAVNQCLRGMVTGCDNLLDDEYKATLETDLPQSAHRFRSVLDIMAADRVLFTLLHRYCHEKGLPQALIFRASNASLHALSASGMQEASEEAGVLEQADPQHCLEAIHHAKTGLLFQSTWAVPLALEETLSPVAASAREALYRIGLACQVLDDIVDLFRDMRQQRHNYVAALLAHQERKLWQEAQAHEPLAETPARFYAACPDFAARVRSQGFVQLEAGLRQLFTSEHQGLAPVAADFIASRIGVGRDSILM